MPVHRREAFGAARVPSRFDRPSYRRVKHLTGASFGWKRYYRCDGQRML